MTPVPPVATHATGGAEASLVGTGVGLRGPHVPHILATEPAVAWFELLTDNHLASAGPARFQAEAIAERYPVALHGVGMNLGGTDPLDRAYLGRVADLAKRLDAAHVSEHLAFTAHGGWHVHELLPLPRTPESLEHVASRVREVQDVLGAPLVVENISTYLEFADDSLDEGEYLAALVSETGCRLLVDVNNLVVNAANHGGAPDAAFAALPWDAVAEIHVAGHERRGDLVIDTHSRPVPDAVLSLLADAVRRAPRAPVLVEWDREIPEFPVLQGEARRTEDVRRVAAGSAA